MNSYSVSPTFLVAETVVGGYLGETVLLECKVEAWPRAVNYWEKDGRVLAAGPKHKIVEMEESIQYKFVWVFHKYHILILVHSTLMDINRVPGVVDVQHYGH